MTRIGRSSRAMVATIATMALVTAAAAFACTPAVAADDPLPSPPPLLQRDNSVVSGDPLPTVQIDNGYVWSQVVVGSTVYAVGQFANARAAQAAPGTSLTARSNILAYDINTGALLPFAPSVNGTIKAVAASPDGQRIYIGGSFNTVNEQTRWNVAALDAKTGQLVPGFAPSIGGSGVYALTADGGSLYVGGLFTQANGTGRKNIAAFSAANGALRTDWDSQSDQQVDAMVLDPGGQDVVLGGRFADVDGDGRWRGMVAINSANGSIDNGWLGTTKIKNGMGTGGNKGKAGIFALNADATGIYGTGWVYADAATGNIEGVYALEAGSGSLRWIADCLGDHYGVYSTGSVVYSTSHTHACSTMGLWPEQSPRTHKYISAMTTQAKGTLGHQPAAGGTYVDWYGEKAPAAYAWYPDFGTGNTSGLGQAGLSITGAGNVISVAGEFTSVDNRQFEGIVRFSTTPAGGAKDGPRTTTASWGAPTAQTLVPGRVRITIAGTWDRDDRDLTYDLMRTGSSTPIDSVTLSSGWWNVPSVVLEDSTVQPGQSNTYRVVVRDGNGNGVTSGTVTATASQDAAIEYANAVLGDGASLYYPLGSNTTDDWAGGNPPIFGSGVQSAQPSAVHGSATGYSMFDGSDNGRVSSTNKSSTPGAFTTELWFKTTTNQGGKLIGYGNERTGTSGSYDRHIYMRNDGRLTFGVYTGQTDTIASSTAYNDGVWHQVASSQDSSGMKLYVDGSVVATNPNVTTGEGFSGFWRIGGDNLNSWPDQPASNWFAGGIDEVAVYPQALSAAQIATHYALGVGLKAPTASFSSTTNDLNASFDASGSAVGGPGSIVKYSWDFGDGSPKADLSKPDATHPYAASGTYTVTLTVTDSNGLIGTAQNSVTVLGPNALPSASFVAGTSGLAVNTNAAASTDADGTIASYAWNWGDGSAVTTGVVGSHDYVLPGNHTITLTVTDDRGGIATTTRTVVTTHAGPVASFQATTTGLAVNVDASASSASDGATMTYSWSWGDGSANTSGMKSSHTYNAAGTFDVSLSVSDSLGGTSTSTRSIAVVSTVYAALDDFERVVTNGWGAATTGGTWTTMSGSATAASVNGTQGVLALAPGGTRHLALQGVSLTNSESALDYTMQYGPEAGAAGYVGLTARNSASNAYTLQAWHRSNGTVWLVAQQSNGTVIASKSISGLTWKRGDSFSMKVEVSGTNPTNLRGKIWAKGAAEPQTWQLEATDSTAGLQQAGYPAVRDVLGSTAPGTGTVVFDRVAIRNLDQPAANIPPVAGFTSTATGKTVAVDGSTSSDADGTISSYSWNWGDNTAASAGITTSHSYTAAGTFQVTLTVVDNAGASHSTTKAVTVTAPAANTPPVAAFSLSTSGLVVSVDGSASADADGSIASYEWAWGDGQSTTSGAVQSHTYTLPGTFTVSLKVTDNIGATHTVSKSITVQAAAQPEGFLIKDDFERTVTASWGTADNGGSWTVGSGAASAASVAAGKGRVNLAAGGTRTLLLGQTPVRDIDLAASVGVDAAPTTGATYVGVVARNVGSSYYLVNAWLRTDGTVWLVAQRGSTVISSIAVPGLTYSAGDVLKIRASFVGSGTTQLQAKAWKGADAEPAAWQLSATDATAELQVAGSAGFRVSRASTSTAPVTVSIDDVRGKAIQ